MGMIRWGNCRVSVGSQGAEDDLVETYLELAREVDRAGVSWATWRSGARGGRCWWRRCCRRLRRRSRGGQCRWRRWRWRRRWAARLAAVCCHGNVDTTLLSRKRVCVDIVATVVAGRAGPESAVAVVHKRSVAGNREVVSRLSALIALPLTGRRSEDAAPAIAIYDAYAV